MSDLNQIQAALNRLFNEEGQRIVFWNDPEREFTFLLSTLQLQSIKLIQLNQIGSMEVKIQIERDDLESKFLLYSPNEEPDYENDWLLDIRLYSRSFRADRASILLQELGIPNLQLRTHIAERRKFFDSKERLARFKNLVSPEDGVGELDRKMIAVIAKADQPELFSIIRAIFHSWLELSPGSNNIEDIDFESSPLLWAQVEKFELDIPFWQMVKTAFGYEEENPTLKNLLLRLMLADFAHHLDGEIPQSLRALLLPRINWSNVVVCLGQWRDSSSKGLSYDVLSAEVARTLKIKDHLSKLGINQMINVMTFLAVEKAIASSLKEMVEGDGEAINTEEVQRIASRRQAGHWASLVIAESTAAPRGALNAVYDALVSAAEFYTLKNSYNLGFDYPDAKAFYHAYESELYKFDQLYRHFCESADKAELAGWGILKSLRGHMEAHYCNWYLTNLSLAWGEFMKSESGLLEHWKISGVPNQYNFYETNIRPLIESSENRKAFVIISDAFRYEAAQELVSELNGKYRFEATLASQLGVLPSYTALGMASMLPHKTLSYQGTDVLVDGRPSNASERNSILQTVNGMACKAEELTSKKKDQGREFVKDKRVIYVYHDTVDAIGDDAKTEQKTFAAVRSAINELAALVTYIINNLNGNQVIVTADHGFLYTESFPGEPDKSKLEEKPKGTILSKKRYLIGSDLPDHEAVWHGKIKDAGGVDCDTEFWIPKGANLFHFIGGARFVHGGAMPQEIVVPVVSVKQVRGKSADDTRIRNVSVQVLGTNHKITTSNCRFQLIQMDAVSERVKPLTLRIAIYDGDEAVTNIQTVKFDSSSSSIDDRKKWVSLVLKDRQFNKKVPCRLLLLDAETEIMQQSVEVNIERAFNDDF